MSNKSKNNNSSNDLSNVSHNKQRIDNHDRNVTQGEKAIPVIEEELNVRKRQVETGGVRVQSNVIETPVEKSVNLREEHVTVDRHPVNRDVTDADIAAVKQGEINVTTRAEQPVVSKQARVVEEVEVGKTVSEHEQTVRDTVKRTDVEVEEVDNMKTRSTTGSSETGNRNNR